MIRERIGDDAWAPLPFLIEAVLDSCRRPRGCWLTLDGLFLIVCAGFPRRDLPDDLGKWNWVYRQTRWWAILRLLELMLDALDCPECISISAQMIG